MELLHLLAFLQILPRLVSHAASLQSPTIIMDPQHPVYFPGERLTLRCLAPGGEAVTSYQFYNQRGEQVNTETTGLSGGPLLVLTAETGKTGAYSCEYWSVRDRRHICSTRSQPVPVPVMDFPLAPSISVISDPPGKTPVTILCSAPPGHVAKRYQFLKQGNVIVSQPGAYLQLHQSDLDTTGPYTCSYEISVSVRMIQSLPSAPLSIHLTAPPLAPKLSLHPKLPVYLPGEKVTLNCSAPHGEEVVGFRFNQHRGDQTLEELPAASRGPWMDLTAQRGTNSSYTCQYWRWEAGQEIVSENSNSITVPVSDPPPQPALSVDPPSGAVSEGFPLLITCMAPKDTSKWRFHFYKDGADVIPGDMGSEISTTEPRIGSANVSVLSIPRAGPESTGEFTCGYEKNMSGRWILSPRSWAVNVTVTAKISPGSIHAWHLWIYLAAGCIAATALLPLLFLIWLCKRRKGAVMAETQPVYVNRPSGAGTALQQWSRQGQVQPVTHNQSVRLNIPRGKPLVHGNPQERGKKEDDADARAINTVYSKVTTPSAVAKQRGGKYISETVVYSKIPYRSQPLPPPRPTPH